MSHEDIEFTIEGATIRGWFYPADGVDGPAACVVAQHGLSAVKEMWLDHYAEVFQAAGMACLLYDHPGFGASDAVPGYPRQEIDPWQQIRFMQHAITYAQTRPEVDPDRIGLWGSSYGGSHAIVVAATDRRIKAVVSQLMPVSGAMAFQQLVRIDHWADLDTKFAEEHAARFAGKEATVIPVATDDPHGEAALPTLETYRWFTETSAERAPSWRNEVTLLSMEYFRGYLPGAWLPLVSPTPLLMVVAPRDRLADGQQAIRAYETALHPKKLALVPGGHFDSYSGPGFEIASGHAREWFVEHLRDA